MPPNWLRQISSLRSSSRFALGSDARWQLAGVTAYALDTHTACARRRVRRPMRSVVLCFRMGLAFAQWVFMTPGGGHKKPLLSRQIAPPTEEGTEGVNNWVACQGVVSGRALSGGSGGPPTHTWCSPACHRGPRTPAMGPTGPWRGPPAPLQGPCLPGPIAAQRTHPARHWTPQQQRIGRRCLALL